MIFLILSILFFVYFVALQIASPGTILGTIFSFSAVWILLSALCAVLFAYRKRHLWKNAKRSVKIAIISVFCVGILISTINLVFICNPRLADGTENCDYVILLGGGITKDKKLTTAVQKRVEKTAEYLKSHPNAIAVVTGGQGYFSPCPESDVLKPALASCGIDENRILAENQAKDTIQNFEYSVKLLCEHTGRSVQEILDSPVTVITNDFHLARAQRLAKKMGFTNVYGAASKTPILFIPTSYGREICSYIKLNLRILLTGKPKHL